MTRPQRVRDKRPLGPISPFPRRGSEAGPLRARWRGAITALSFSVYWVRVEFKNEPGALNRLEARQASDSIKAMDDGSFLPQIQHRKRIVYISGS